MKQRLLVGAFLVSATIGSPVDLQTVFEDALQNDPTWQIAQVTRKSDQQNMLKSTIGLGPTVGFNISQGESSFERTLSSSSPLPFPSVTEGDSEQESWQINASQDLLDVDGWMAWLVERKRNENSTDTLRNAEAQLINRVAQAYFDVLRSQDQLESQLAAEEAVARRLQQAQQRFEVGSAAITDVLDATASYDASKVSTLNVRQTHGIAFESLSTITGVNYPQVNRLVEEVPISTPDPNAEDEWVTTALNNNPQVLIAARNYDAAKLNRKRFYTVFMPRATISTRRSFSRDPLSFFGEETETESVSLNISFDIGNSTDLYSNNLLAVYNVQNAKHNLKLQRLTVERDTRNLYRAINTDVVRVAANKKAIESARAALEATETGYEVGTRNIVEVLTAQQTLYNSMFSYSDSRYNYLLNGLRLKQTAGILSDVDIKMLNRFTTSDDPVTQLTSASGR